MGILGAFFVLCMLWLAEGGINAATLARLESTEAQRPVLR